MRPNEFAKWDYIKPEIEAMDIVPQEPFLDVSKPGGSVPSIDPNEE